MKAVEMTEQLPGSWWEATPTEVGPDNGTWHDWPKVGETAVFPDHVAADLVATGKGKLVQERKAEPPAESRPAPAKAETREAKSAPAEDKPAAAEAKAPAPDKPASKPTTTRTSASRSTVKK